MIGFLDYHTGLEVVILSLGSRVCNGFDRFLSVGAILSLAPAHVIVELPPNWQVDVEKTGHKCGNVLGKH